MPKQLWIARFHLVVAAGLLMAGQRAEGEEASGQIYGSTKTLIRWNQVLDPNDPGSKVFQTPLYEYITLGSDDVGVEGLSVHLRAFGMVHIVDPVEGNGDKFDGDVLIGTITYRCPKGRIFARAGRQFIYYGAANNVLLDGLSFAVRPGLDMEFSGYAGTLAFPSFDGDPSRYAFGARLAYDPWDIGRIGISFAGERGDGQWAHANIGADWAFRYFRFLDLSGSALLEMLDKGAELQEVRSVASVILDRDWRFSLDYGMYNPVGRLPRTSIFTVFTDTRYHAAGGEVGFFSEGMLQARAYGRYMKYSDSREGYEAGLRPAIRFGDNLQNLAGVEVSRLRGPWNAYTALRVFGAYRPISRLDLTADLAEYLYDSDFKGYDRSHVVGLTAGYEVFERGIVQADLVVTINPEFEQQWVGTLRFTYDFSLPSKARSGE